MDVKMKPVLLRHVSTMAEIYKTELDVRSFINLMNSMCTLLHSFIHLTLGVVFILK